MTARPLDVLLINDAFSFYAQAESDAGKARLAEYLPDRERERNGRLFLGGHVELHDFHAWARGCGLQTASSFRE